MPKYWQIDVSTERMARKAIPTWFFVLVIVKKDDKFLLVHERKHEQKWYLPAGRIEPREDFIHAACRETLEETGVPIVINGILAIQHTPILDGSARVRFILSAQPKDETPPKNKPDEESLGAAWMTLDELNDIPLRGQEVIGWCEYVVNGAPVYPANLVTSESPMIKLS